MLLLHIQKMENKNGLYKSNRIARIMKGKQKKTVEVEFSERDAREDKENPSKLIYDFQ